MRRWRDTPVPSMKQIRIKAEDTDELIMQIQDSLMIHNYVILDTYKENALGGTGEKFNWNDFKILSIQMFFLQVD